MNMDMSEELEELDELEEDRMACKMADDVEVVAVPAKAPTTSSASTSSPTAAAVADANGYGGRGGKMMTKREARKLALSSSQRLKGSAGSSMSPGGSQVNGPADNNSFANAASAHDADVDNNNSTAHGDGRSLNAAAAAAGNNPGSPGGNTTDNGGGPMLKGVQIYLRQRSTNEVVKRGKN